MKVGLVYDPIYLKHDTGQHPENASRLVAIVSHLERTGLKKQLKSIKPRPATIEELSLAHDKRHISHVQEVAQRGGGWLDGDTVMSPDSYDTALYAAGGTVKATDAVMNGDVDSAFALVRPPGHHATHQEAMGFCLFNNVAVAAKYALVGYELERILIIDFDVHHGNGTQDIFYDDPQVLYISTHQYPFYPGTGGIGEIGTGEGRGTTINIPLPAGCGDSEYEQVFKQIIVPAARRFQPRLILVSAGYDLHWSDGLALMQVTVSGFAWMVKVIKELADELYDGGLIFSLEGGYDLTALAASVKATLDVLLGNTVIDDPLGQSTRRLATPSINQLIKAVQERHGLY